jgi:cytoskeletal protein CcmA (bactofilin family)
MALLGRKNKETTAVNKVASATIITSCTEVTGNLQGSDTMHIDGKVTGNITVSNTLIIGKSGVVKGEVKAKNAIINGELDGKITCDTLEVMQTGKLSNEIEAKELILDGKVDGNIVGLERVNVLTNGVLNVSKIQSKYITVNGSIKGKIVASEMLDIGSTGSVEGEISVKSIKTAEGGKMIGTMATYEAEKPKAAPKVAEPKAKEGA